MLMQPQSPAPPPPLQPMPQQTPSPEQNPYGFIMDDKSAPKPKGLAGLMNPGSGSKKTKIIMLISGVFLLLIVGWMLISLLTGGSKVQNEKLISIAQDQTEMIRLSNLANNSQSIRETSTRNLAVNTLVVMETNRKQIVSLLAQNKKKIKEKQLSETKDAKSDAQLDTAVNNNTFDQTFNTILQKLLSSHRQKLKEAFDASNDKTEKEVLSAQFKSVGILLEQSDL